MSVVPDRVVAACGGDLEYAQHVWDSLERVRLLRENGGTPTAVLSERPLGEPGAASPTGRVNPGSPNGCPTCLHELDETGFCSTCGRLEKRETAAPRPSSGTAPTQTTNLEG